MHVNDKYIQSLLLLVLEMAYDGKNNFEILVYSISRWYKNTEQGDKQGKGNTHRVMKGIRKCVSNINTNYKRETNDRKVKNINPEAEVYSTVRNYHNIGVKFSSKKEHSTKRGEEENIEPILKTI